MCLFLFLPFWVEIRGGGVCPGVCPPGHFVGWVYLRRLCPGGGGGDFFFFGGGGGAQLIHGYATQVRQVGDKCSIIARVKMKEDTVTGQINISYSYSTAGRQFSDYVLSFFSVLKEK